MDPKSTGKFIAELRREKNLTQEKLAEQINVSNKAISRWETGKGYPDVTSLAALSDFFNVSINELLNGKRVEKEQLIITAENNMKHMLKAAEKKKKKTKKIIIISVISVLSLIIGYIAASLWNNYTRLLMGSPNCIVAEDYSKITYYGQTYIPLETGEAEYIPTDKIVPEATVENTTIFDKLFFGEAVYGVMGSPFNELIQLNTDYDYLTTELYCREDKYEYYSELVKNAKPEKYYLSITNPKWGSTFLELDEDFKNDFVLNSDKLKDISDNYEWGGYHNGDDYMRFLVWSTDGIFMYDYGEIQRTSGEYYWYDTRDKQKPNDSIPFYEIINEKVYKIPDKYDELFNNYFSYQTDN